MAHVSDLWGDYLNSVRNPVWSDIYEAYRPFVSPTEDAYERQWCGRCEKYAGNENGMVGPVWICDTDCYDGRLGDSVMFRRYWERQLDMEQTELIPCTWCGFRSSTMCGSCNPTNGPASALCRRCENEQSACRLCWAITYVKRQSKPILPDCVIHRRTNSVTCSTCAGPATLQCAGCGTIPYCSAVCQRKDWKHHKSVCKMLRKGCKVFCLYKWHQPVKKECREWAIEYGERERYYKCFGRGE